MIARKGWNSSVTWIYNYAFFTDDAEVFWNHSGGFYHVTDGVNLSTANWRHVAATYDHVTGVVKIYVDGVERHSSSESYLPAPMDGPLMIGGTIAGDYFHGAIDDLRIYNRVLSQAEIAADMNTPVGGGGSTPPPPASDTTPPSVAISAPTNGATISGTVSVSANAADNVGVVGGSVSP